MASRDASKIPYEITHFIDGAARNFEGLSSLLGRWSSAPGVPSAVARPPPPLDEMPDGGEGVIFQLDRLSTLKLNCPAASRPFASCGSREDPLRRDR